MNIIPKPKSVQEKEGFFHIKNNIKVAVAEICPYEVIKYAFDFTKEIYDEKNLKLGVTRFNSGDYRIKTEKCENFGKEEYSVEISPENIVIKASEKAGFFYAFKTLKQIVLQSGAEIKSVYIHDFPDIEVRGFYHDVTRGKVPTMETLKYLADKAAEYKLNQLQLYIEHTFAFRGMSEVWRGSDCLSAEDILEFDAYCRERNIELVPSFATFGHLYHLLTTYSFKEFCEVEDCVGKRYSWFDRQVRYTVNPVNSGSIKLIKRIIDEVSPLFTSDKFNICCDETFDLGREKSKAEAERIGKGELYLKFMKQICDCVRENNKKPMCWSDIILQHSELLGKLPEDVTYMNWGYSRPVNEEAVKTIAETGFDFYVCGGTSGWNRITNNIKLSEVNLRTTAKCGFECGAKGFLNTDWGDMGHINSLYTSIPGLIIGAAYGWNTEGDVSFEEISEAEYKENITVKLLAELADCEKFNWADLVSLREQEYGDGNDVLKCWVNDDFDKVRPFETIEQSYENAMEIKENLEKIMYKSDMRKEYEAFIIAAEGIALFNALYAAVKVKKFVSDARLIMEMSELAEKLELWLYDYEKTWRESYRESELFRIRECVFYACDKLRIWDERKDK